MNDLIGEDVMMKRRWNRLSDNPRIIEELRKLSEGSRIPNFESSDSHLFFRIEGRGKDSKLLLLTKEDLGNMVDMPMVETYPLEQVDVYIETGEIWLPYSFSPEKINPGVFGDCRKYSRMIKNLR